MDFQKFREQETIDLKACGFEIREKDGAADFKGSVMMNVFTWGSTDKLNAVIQLPDGTIMACKVVGLYPPKKENQHA